MPTLRKIKMYYDPLGRVVKTVNPDKSEQQIVYGIPESMNTPGDVVPTPWENYAYDANDLASLTNPSSLVPASHNFTPKSSLVDALGRTIKTTEFFSNSNYNDTIVMKYTYDVRGNLLLVQDPYNRSVFTHVYDLRPSTSSGAGGEKQPLPPLKTVHIDKGLSTVLFDALGKPIESFDAKGAHSLSAYDTLQRPNNSWACNKTGDTITLRNHIIYGDDPGVTTPTTFNLNAQVYQSYDEAGRVETPLYDFKGNLLEKKRRVIDSGVLKTQMNSYNNFIIDWTNLPSILDTTDYETTMEYDALNRITQLKLPTDLDAERKKIVPTYNRAGALEKVDLITPTTPTPTVDNYVENIVYNAKGQRLLIAFGNNRMTRYAYDPITFRLLRQRTEGYTKTTVSNVVTYAYSAGTNKQDDGFDYDLVGNIMNIFIRVTDCGIGGTPDELDRDFEYDPIYRLTSADGRESNTQSGNNFIYTDAPAPSTPVPSNVRAYTRTYDYDKLGNIKSVVQSGTNGFTRAYVYNSGQNTLDEINDGAVSPTTIEDYTYDACGNTITTNLSRYYIWNHADQLLCYKNSTGTPTIFTQYDYAGQDRVSKMVKTTGTYERTIYIDGIFEYVKLENGTTYEKNYIHIMDDKSRIAEVRINPGTAFPGDITDDIVYILEDQIGSSVVRLNTAGTVIDEEEYYPFGDSSLRTFIYKRYRYVGKERDQESGLYYYGARYYAAWTCRFISVDPLAGKYAHLTPYNYTDNNPINDYDIDGMQDKNTQATPTGSGGSVPQGNTGSSGGCMTCPQTNATEKPSGEMPATVRTGPPKEAKLYDASSPDAPGAWRHSEGFQAGAETKKGLNDYEKSGGTNTIVKIGIVFDKLITPELQNIGVGAHLQKQSSPSPKILTEKVDFSNLKISPTQQKPAYGIGSGVAKPISDGKYTNIAILKPYEKKGGGHHIPAQNAFKNAPNYDPLKALAMPNSELARLNIEHGVITGAQKTLYTSFAKTGATLTWGAVVEIETKALIKAGMDPVLAQNTVNYAVTALRFSGVQNPTKIPWGGK